MNTDVPCRKCGGTILAATAERTGGLCMACQQGIRQNIEASQRYYHEQRNHDLFREDFRQSRAYHQVIAAGAYRQLSAVLQKTVSEFLESHPDYGRWEKSFTSESASVDLRIFIFLRASVWPDEIRFRGNHNGPLCLGAGCDPSRLQHNHPKWHYLEYPLKPTQFPVEPGADPDDDILHGIRQCERTLADSITSPEDRAVYLSWLFHLIGDLHLPLHCGSLFTSEFPTGDKGGNAFFIKPGASGISLHSFWDGLLGASEKPGTCLNTAAVLQFQHPRDSLPELNNARTPKDWSLESRRLAVEMVYLHGELKGGTSRETAVVPPEGYTKAARVVAEKQAALAGYRLADEIQNWVK